MPSSAACCKLSNWSAMTDVRAFSSAPGPEDRCRISALNVAARSDATSSNWTQSSGGAQSGTVSIGLGQLEGSELSEGPLSTAKLGLLKVIRDRCFKDLRPPFWSSDANICGPFCSIIIALRNYLLRPQPWHGIPPPALGKRVGRVNG